MAVEGVAVARPLQRFIKRHPIAFKSGVGLVTAGSGDLVAQHCAGATQTAPAVDHRRLSIFSLFGALWTGPVNHLLLGRLDKRYPIIGGWKGSLVPKLAWQTLVFTPLLWLPCYLAMLTLGIKNLSLKDAAEYARHNYSRILFTTTVVWLPINGLGFAFVPEPLQSVVFSAIGFAWNTYLSISTTKASTGSVDDNIASLHISEDKKDA